ncbi:MAG: membrane protein insertase YidC [Burkholderiales bacterium]|nr:membrane protein insertase YidC [Burkholderiales bacterium]
MDFQRLVLFVIFAMSGVFLFQAWQKENAPPKPPAAVTAAADKKADVPTTTSATNAGTPPAAANGSVPAAGSAAASASAPVAAAAGGTTGDVVTVSTDLFDVKINTLGGVIEEVALKEHRDAADKSKPYLVLLKSGNRKHIAQSGLLGTGMPNHLSLYSKPAGDLTLGSNNQLEVRLSTPLSGGGKSDLIYTFKRGSYVIDVTHEVTNGGTAAISPTAYFQVQRDSVSTGINNPMGASAFHGPVLYTDEKKYQKIDFKDVEKGKPGIPTTRLTDGWIGMVEHYFVDVWLPKAGMPREYFVNKVEGDAYTAGLKTPFGDIAAGASARVSVPLFAGPQEQDLLKAAAPELDRVVDYGVFAFIAAPMFWLLRWFHGLVANWGWAIVLLTVLIKAVFYPLNAAAGRSMGKMKLVGPKMKELQTRYADDRVKLNQAMMELYKKEKINPLGGCLPILIQIPVFIALYWVLSAAVELRHAPWIGWIKDLSAADPLYILPVLYGITAFAQSKMQPPAPGMDPLQQKVLQYMPVAFAAMFIFFPAGLVLYWTVSNILQIAQQWQINRMLEKESAAATAAAKR